MKQVKDRYFYKIWALYIFLFSFGIHLNAKGRYLPEWKEYVVMQADMSSTITQVETLQSYLEQGIEAVMVKDDAILRKQATEKGMVILSQKTLEICQQRQKSKGSRCYYICTTKIGYLHPLCTRRKLLSRTFGL